MRSLPRARDRPGLLAVLDPDVAVRADRSATPPGVATAAHGTRSVAEKALAFAARARFAQIALVNGTAGLIVAPTGKLLLALAFTFAQEKITQIDVISDPERLRALGLATL